jgi:hypothetical protein
VQFDGSCLRWPKWTDSEALGQARNNARTLSQFLGGAVGETVYVTPILTLPGWMVDRLVPPSKVHVVNPKEILAVVSNAKEHRLSENLIKRICFQLARCANWKSSNRARADVQPVFHNAVTSLTGR